MKRWSEESLLEQGEFASAWQQPTVSAVSVPFSSGTNNHDKYVTMHEPTKRNTLTRGTSWYRQYSWLCNIFLVSFSLAILWAVQLRTDDDKTYEGTPYLTTRDYAAQLDGYRKHRGRYNVHTEDIRILNEDSQACVTALECGPGQYCAFPSLHNMSLRICCAEARNLGFSSTSSANLGASTGASVLLDPWLTVCTGAAVGEACGSHHDLCATGLCIRGKCASQGLPQGAKCPDHLHCQSKACGYLQFYQHEQNNQQPQQQQCCPANGISSVSLLPHETGLAYTISACGGTATLGEPCGGRDALCAKGLLCHTQKQVCVEQDSVPSRVP